MPLIGEADETIGYIQIPSENIFVYHTPSVAFSLDISLDARELREERF